MWSTRGKANLLFAWTALCLAFAFGGVEAQSTPASTPLCTIANDCFGRATAVVWSPALNRCSCTCTNSWFGDQCQLCIANYSLTDCNSCNTAKGYDGTFPDCPPIACTVADCNSGGDPVGGDKVSGCICACYSGTGWYGQTCDKCALNWDQSADAFCSSCAQGYGPLDAGCPFMCTIAANCSGHATTVTGNSNTGCNCTCDPVTRWYGATCNLCPNGTDPAANCRGCISGWGGYPNCSPLCDANRLALCGPNAIEADGTTLTGCKCICKNQWTGAKCDTCPTQYNVSSDCGSCNDAYTGYPNCSLKCTDANCSYHSVDVTGTNAIGCTCTCRNKWYGSNCSQCQAGYNASAATDCGYCMDGYSGASCQKLCSSTADCDGHASSATGYVGACTCNCRNGWRGATCTSCTTPYSGLDCEICVPGFIGTPPDCVKNCSTVVDCSSHAFTVQGFLNGTCACNCRHKWSGSQCEFCPPNYDQNPDLDCQVCAQGYEQYPGCYLKCTNQFNCTGRAYNVTGNGLTGCTCYCLANWTGPTCSICPTVYDQSTCDKCAAGRINYPVCQRACDVVTDCSNHAINVTGGFPDCSCACRNFWYDSRCSSCPSIYNPDNDCGTCAAAYEKYPDCFLKCTNSSNCTSHAAAVSGNVFDGCNCTCQTSWFGAKCDQCPTLVNASKNCNACINLYGGYPNCKRICTLAQDCGGTKAVSVSGLDGACVCSCANQWTNATCDVCPAVYNASKNCGACIDTRDTYPQCYLTCTTIDNCTDHATSVTGNNFKGCTCKCRNQWTGAVCDQCASIFNASLDCGVCADGYGNYPTCARICTDAIDCNSRSVNVTGLYPSCKCTCGNAWTGSSCQICTTQYNVSTNCSTCADAYSAFSVFPKCYLTCTDAANCTSHSVNVTGNIVSGCNCTCRNLWYGAKCASCPPLVQAAADCGVCITGYQDYPNCVRTCTNATDCSNNAVEVYGTAGNCSCVCRNQWYGPDCSKCNSNFDSSKAGDCGTCAAAYEKYPDCFLKCTNAANCTSHAAAVSGNVFDGCNCTCQTSWFGAKCDQCPTLVNASKNCNACINLYGGYPNCKRICTLAQDCGGTKAVNVSGLEGACVCSCANQWTNATCDVCPAVYNASKNCGACIDTRDTYPKCYLTCTTKDNCTDHAVNVTGNDFKGCTCKCRNQWTGAVCDVCTSNYNTSLDCGACAEGFDSYPACARICTNETDCSLRATNVSGLFPNCNCKCRNAWYGPKCQFCPPGYSALADCASCADGYDGVYPICYLRCTNAANCTNNAQVVTGNTNTGCNCTCRNQWSGPKCNFCAAVYDNSTDADCGICTFGYAGYPNCVRTCTISLDCNNNADNITGAYPNCTCGCRNQWYGDKCQYCNSKYNNQSDCGTCAPAYEVYPFCFAKCTSVLNCSGNAAMVSGNANTTCNCTCRASWNGTKCDQCPANVDPLQGCGACIFGYKGYPNCQPLCSNANCTNRALKVGGTYPNCTCLCLNSWDNYTHCSECPKNFNVSNNCYGCAAGYEVMPYCYRTCNMSYDCYGNAVAVTGNDGPKGCSCTCRNQWNVSANCSTCPSNFNETLDCGACADGYDDYPRCIRKCTSLLDCNDHAANVTGLVPNCTCTCRNQWVNKTCDFCADIYAPGYDCDVCAKYRENYPNCTLRKSPTPEKSRTTSYSPSDSDSPSGSRNTRTWTRGTRSLTINATESWGNVTDTRTFTPPRTITPGRTITPRRRTQSATVAPPTTTAAPTTTALAPNTTTPSPNTTLPPSTTPNVTMTTTNTTAPTTTTHPTTVTTTPAPTNVTTLRPNTTVPPMTTTPAPTTPRPSTAPPRRKRTHTSTISMTKSLSVSYTNSATQSESLSLRLCDRTVECNGHGNATTVKGPPRSCSCSCDNQWSSFPQSSGISVGVTGQGCAVCAERFDEDRDCNACAVKASNTSLFPTTCHFSAHIVGNWSLPYCNAPGALEMDYLAALSQDLADLLSSNIIVTTTATSFTTSSATDPDSPLALACPTPLPLGASFAAVLAKNASAAALLNVIPTSVNPLVFTVATVQIVKLIVNKASDGALSATAMFDVNFTSTSSVALDTATDCVKTALSKSLGALGTAVVLVQGSNGTKVVASKTPVMASTVRLNHVASYLSQRQPAGSPALASACTEGSGNFTANSSNVSVCFPIGCGAPFDTGALESGGSSGFPFWIIGAIVGGLVALALVVVALLRFAFPKVGSKVLPSRWFVDGTKYTINFSHMDEMDEELRLMTAEREIEFDDI